MSGERRAAHARATGNGRVGRSGRTDAARAVLLPLRVRALRHLERERPLDEICDGKRKGEKAAAEFAGCGSGGGAAYRRRRSSWPTC